MALFLGQLNGDIIPSFHPVIFWLWSWHHKFPTSSRYYQYLNLLPLHNFPQWWLLEGSYMNVLPVNNVLHNQLHCVTKILWMRYFNCFYQFRCHLSEMKSLFSQLALFFPQFWVFEAIFEAHGQNFLIFKNSICTFYCTQNDRLDPTVSMQKLVWKSDHRGPRNLQNYFSTWHAKPNRNLILFFLKYLGLGWSVFQTNFCIETVGSRWSFWVQ